MASNLMAMASNLEAIASNLEAPTKKGTEDEHWCALAALFQRIENLTTLGGSISPHRKFYPWLLQEGGSQPLLDPYTFGETPSTVCHVR